MVLNCLRLHVTRGFLLRVGVASGAFAGSSPACVPVGRELALWSDGGPEPELPATESVLALTRAISGRRYCVMKGNMLVVAVHFGLFTFGC